MKSIKTHLTNKKKYHKEQKCVVDEKTIKHLFSRIVREEYGRQGEKNIIPSFYKDGTIFVEIHNSVWAQELWIRRDFFIHALNQKIGNDVVVDIKIST